jgi:hypothetical protein
MTEYKEQLQVLFEKMLQDGMSPAERVSFEKLIQSSKEARAYYVELCQMHAMLSEEHGAFASGMGTFKKPNTSKKSKAILRFVFSLAALLAIGFIIPLAIQSKKPDSKTPFRGEAVATLSGSIGAQFSFGGVDGKALVEGDTLHQGVYELTKGLIEISYNNGARLIVESPSLFEIINEKEIGLKDGQLSATIPPAATGFTVHGSGVSIVDLGTEFSVYASSGKFLETHVYKGLVQLDLHFETGDRSFELPAGQAVRILAGSSGPVPAGIDLKDDFFIRSINEPSSKYADLIMSKEPVAYYPMSISSDSETLKDRSIYKNDGRAADVKDQSSLWSAGKIGSAIQLSGSNHKAYVYVSDYPKAEHGKISVVGWVNAESRPSWATIVKNWGNRLYGQFHFGLNPAGLLDVEISPKGGDHIHITESTSFPLKSWQHVAFVHDGKTVRVYRNGEVVAQGDVDGLNYPVALKKMSIGTKLDDYELMPAPGSPGHWDGRLDEIAIFNKALSTEEIRELYDISK